MLPTDFKYRNLVLSKPQSMTDEECMPLPVWTDGTRYISKWRLNREERDLIAETGEFYFEITGAFHPAICPSVECPLNGEYPQPGDRVKGFVDIPKDGRIITLPVEGVVRDIQGLLVLDTGLVQIPFYVVKSAEIITDCV